MKGLRYEGFWFSKDNFSVENLPLYTKLMYFNIILMYYSTFIRHLRYNNKHLSFYPGNITGN